MRRLFSFISAVLLLVCASGCQHPPQPSASSFVILQLNDVYEIAPLENGRVGGMARVASIRKQLLQKNPNTITIMAGDFVNPSLISTLRDAQGKPIRGAQMIEAMNAAGVDYATFGNHEFDIPEQDLLERIRESRFQWISCNVLHKTPEGEKPFLQSGSASSAPIPPFIIHTFKTPSGKTVRCGLIGVTVPLNMAAHVAYKDVTESVRAAYDSIKDRCDVVVLISHLRMVEDAALAETVPGIPLLLGGHDHENMRKLVGKTIIAKADANAKTVYAHHITCDDRRGVSIRSELIPVDESVPADPETSLVVEKWLAVADQSMRAMGVDPKGPLGSFPEPLDGRESVVRRQSSNLTRLITDAMLAAAGTDADGSLYNSGSIRVDDLIYSPVTESDVLRALPFGGPLVIANFSGEMLTKTLETGTVRNFGIGGFLQLGKIEKKNGQWEAAGKPVRSDGQYRIILPEFLIQGREQNMAFLKDYPARKPESFGPTRNDMRAVVIDYLKARNRQ